jgi:hypothetical protein
MPTIASVALYSALTQMQTTLERMRQEIIKVSYSVNPADLAPAIKRYNEGVKAFEKVRLQYLRARAEESRTRGIHSR